MNITIKKTENNYDINITFNETLLNSNVSIGNLQDLITSILKEIEHDRFSSETPMTIKDFFNT